jgi:tRNA:m4X modification enzyme
LEENVEAHVKKCPATKISRLSEIQSYFCQGVNARSEEEGKYVPLLNLNSDVGRSLEDDKSRTSAEKRKANAGLSEIQFGEFVKRIESAHEACCLGSEDEQFLQPQECLKWWDPDRDRFVAPFR